MVQVLKEDIANKIFESARREFFARGFKGATMRNIAAGAGIPVGLVYSYYANKKKLFEAIVQPIYSVFEHLLTEEELNKAADKPHKDQNLFDELRRLLELFKYSREDFLIMIDKSQGTKYEEVRNDLIRMTEIHIKKGMLSKISNKNKDIDDFFFHILANNFMESIFEIGRHYKGEAWASQMLKFMAQQYFYGVNSF